MSNLNLEDRNTKKSKVFFLKRPILSKIYWWLFFGPWTWLFWMLSKAIPKQNNLYIFGSNEGKYFSDNSRALFEHIKNNEPSIKAIWFTDNSNVFDEIESKFPGSVVKSPSIRASFLYLKAQQAIISFGFQDLCKMPWIPSIGVNQLWHGIPIKKIGLLRDSTKTKSDYGPTWPIFTKWMKNVDRFFVASEYEKRAHIQAFGIPKDRFILSGNPRNDRLYRIREEDRKPENVILYAPTFRSRHQGGQNSEYVLIHPDLNEKIIHDFLVQNNARLIVRPHWIEGKRNFNSNRIDCLTHDDEPDLHQIFTESDILITDYSSAFIDWLILDRPVIFAPYDLHTYQYRNGFLEDYEDLVPQPICMEADEILIEIERNILDKNRHQENRRKAADRYLGDGSFGICEQITDIIKKTEISP